MILRKKLIAGNWKMNKTPAEALVLAQEIAAAVGKQSDVDVVICPPFTALTTVAPVLDGTLVKLGAQNMHPEASGAFTGEVSAPMLRAFFATHVILGHSERRSYFGETDAFINQKGSTKLAVHAFYRSKKGLVVYAAGEHVYLVPVTPYTEQRFRQIYGRAKQADVLFLLFSDSDPEYRKYVRSTKAESDGRCTFENVAPGEYFVTTSITYQPEDSFLPEGDMIYERVKVAAGDKEVKVIV